MFLMSRLSASVSASAVMLAVLLAGCGTTPIHYGPPDLDTTSPNAPHCEPQTYPPMAKVAGDRGTVLVSAQVAPDGRVTAAELKSSTGSAALDEASVRAAKGCTFSPAALAGAPKGKMVVITLVWDLLPGMGRGEVGHFTAGVQPSLQP